MRKNHRSIRAITLLPLLAMPLLAIGATLVAGAQDVPTDVPEGDSVPEGDTEGDPGGDPDGDPEGDTAEPASTGPQEVHVGLFLHHVPELDLRSNSYLADFYLWFRWNGPLDPTETFEFTNLVDGWDVMRVALYTNDEGEPEPDVMPDGSLYQVFHIQGRFGHPFDVHDYPFDAQQIVILVEEAEHPPDTLVYVVDDGTDRVHDTLEIPGWDIGVVDPIVRDVVYATNFGDPRRTPGTDHYTQLRYSLRVARPVLGNLVMTVLPIAVVMLITFVMFGVESKYFEGRLGLGITSLISAVALQLTAAGDLPPTGYLVLLDQIYNVSYVVIFLSLLESVIAVRLYDADRLAASRRLDIVTLFAMTFLFFGGIALIIIFR